MKLQQWNVSKDIGININDNLKHINYINSKLCLVTFKFKQLKQFLQILFENSSRNIICGLFLWGCGYYNHLIKLNMTPIRNKNHEWNPRIILVNNFYNISKIHRVCQLLYMNT